MANLNSLTGLVPVIYEAMDVVAREQVGFVSSVTKDASAEAAALNQPIRSHVTPKVAASDITPGAYAPDSGGQTINYVDLTITKNRKVEIQWTGDEQRSVGSGIGNVVRDQFAQALRALTNEVEADLASAALLGASRAVGTAGTSPFGTAGDFSDFAAVQRVLDDNGAPIDGRFLVNGSAAMANLRGKQSVLFKANEAGSDEFLRSGILGQVEGLNIKSSRFVQKNTAGTGLNFVVDGAHAAGSTSIKVKTGTGTILAGNVIAIGGVHYVVAGALTGGYVTLAAPGLVEAAADGDTVTLGATYVGNIGLHSSGLLLAARVPAMPAGGDSAADVMNLTDPVSGLTYQVALYKGYRQIHMEIGLAWGTKVIKPEFITTLRG